MAKLITINGPLGVGKTWVSLRLQEYFGIQGIQFVDVSFQKPLESLAREMVDAPKDMPYDLFKKTLFFGVSGRDWMINISENAKTLYAPIWVHKSFNKISKAANQERTIFLADSQGFPIELAFLDEKADRKELELMTISIEPPDKTHLRGKLWQENDSRFNLAHMTQYVAPDSNEAYWLLKNKIQERGWA